MKKQVLLGLSLLVLGTYGYGVLAYETKYNPRTYINDLDVSGLSVDTDIMSEIRKKDSKINKKTIIKSKYHKDVIIDNKEYISIKDTNFSIDNNNKLWFLGYITPNKHIINYEYEANYDKLSGLIDKSGLLEEKESPKDATLLVKNGNVTIVDSKEGKTVKKDDLLDLIKQEIKNDNFTINYDSYEKAKVLSDDKKLNALKDETYKKINNKIDIDIKGHNYSLDLRELYDSVYINQEKLKTKLNEIADKTDTLNKERDFVDVNGKKRTILNGSYGWKIDKDKTFNKVIERIENRDFSPMKPVYSSYGFTRENQDIGNTYIEIDLSKQKLWIFEDGKLTLDSKLVSGRVPKNFTPVGMHSIKWKQRNTYLIGKNRTTKKKYKSFVKYWMPIDYQGIGLHDASWQGGDFGDWKYKTQRGSNGCINLPEKIAKYIYENLKDNTPVIIYESSTNYSKNKI